MASGATGGIEIRKRTMKFQNQKVMITGGTGFIGGRLVERLVIEEGAKIRAIVRNFSHASRLARFPIEMIGGDIIDEDVVSKAAEGCDVIFHCAHDFAGTQEHKKEVAVKGTENVCKAALKNGVKRLVYVSTVSVYGTTPDGDLDENSPKQPSEDGYTKIKRAAEELVMDYHRHHGLPVSIVQPTIVYGPFSGAWTISPLKQLSTGQVVLPNEGQGFCNAVYIDDVIDAMFLAAIKDEAIGEVFLISHSEPVTWREFYGAMEELLGRTGTVSMSDKEIDDLQKSGGLGAVSIWAAIRAVIKLIREPAIVGRVYQLPDVQRTAVFLHSRFPRLYNFAVSKALGRNSAGTSLPTKTAEPEKKQRLYLPDKTRHELLRSRTRVRIDKARRLLGYEPKYDFKKGMSLTAEFLKWANMV
jgi:nucleoside-diphosphate-sugar epimerase